MPITIDGTGSISGLSAGGLPDASVVTADLADGAATTPKIPDNAITAPKLNGAQSGSAPIYAARAYVSFDGTGTVAIKASGNVTSITDHGIGDYSINFTTALASANAAIILSAVNTTAANSNNIAIGLRAPSTAAIGSSSLTASAARITARTSSGNNIDVDHVSASVFL